MKKTLTINLNSIVFNIDEDAYEVLDRYLYDVNKHFVNDTEKDEIVADIEARIAELFNERLQRHKNVITINDINEIIGIMGNPNQFSEEPESKKEEETTPPCSDNQEKKKFKKKFYRDPENAILGGIAAGLSAYTNIDVTIIRIIFVILVIVGIGMTIPVYILIWIVAPAATSPSQRLEMQGEDVTIENIKSEFNNAKNYVQSDKFKDSAKSVGRTIGDVFRWIIKAFITFIGVILGFVGFIVVAALLFALFAVIFDNTAVIDMLPDSLYGLGFFTMNQGIFMIISLLLVIGCPIFMLIYWAIRIVSGRRDKSTTTLWVAFALWIAGILMLIGFSASAVVNMKKYDSTSWLPEFSVEKMEYIDKLNISYFTNIDTYIFNP